MQDCEDVKKELIERQKELEATVKTINSDGSQIEQPSSNDWPEQAIGKDEILEDLGEASQNELLQIKAILKRIDNGTYRNCDVCSELIPMERLQLLPQTTHCTRCAEELEEARAC